MLYTIILSHKVNESFKIIIGLKFNSNIFQI
jgi:hypothetical protein